MRAARLGAVASVALAAGGLAAGALAAPSMTAGTAMTGNPQGIKLAHQVMRAFARIPAYRQTEQHFFQIKSNRRARTLSYRFGVPHRPGFYWAREQEVVALRRNRVVWWRDELTPVSGHESPAELVVNKSGRYSAFGTPAHHSCFARIASGSSLPYRYGGLGYSIGGRMKAPQDQSAGTEVLPYVYRWRIHQTANESDTIKRASKLVISGTVDITRRGGARALAFQFANAYPQRRPPEPRVKLCS